MKIILFLCSVAALVAIVPFAASSQSLAVSGKTENGTTRGNLAIVATASSSSRFGQPLNFLNDGLTPTNQGNRSGGGNRQQQARTNMWIQYEWAQPVGTKEVAVY